MSGTVRQFDLWFVIVPLVKYQHAPSLLYQLAWRLLTQRSYCVESLHLTFFGEADFDELMSAQLFTHLGDDGIGQPSFAHLHHRIELVSETAKESFLFAGKHEEAADTAHLVAWQSPFRLRPFQLNMLTANFVQSRSASDNVPRMLVLGIDPGTRNLGWGLVRGEGNRVQHIAHGVLRVRESLPLQTRLLHIEQGLNFLLTQYQPEVGSVESLFFHKDAQAASKLGHARGVVLLVLERSGLALAEYAPARVKQTLTGGGRAEKIQVANMIKMLLNLSELPPPDAADALALAVTHLRRAPIDARLGERTLPQALVGKLKPRGRRPRGGSPLPARLRG